MVSFEQEIKAYLNSRKLDYKDGSSSFKRLDFSVKFEENWLFHFDAKEKRQKINLYNWKITAEQEPHTFIIDDLAARKILAFGPYSGMVVRDNLLGGYYFYSILDLFLMPKTRVNRPIEKNTKAMKGKWVIDLRSGTKSNSLDETLNLMKNYINKREELFLNILDCYGNYHGENIGERGEVRRAAHWDTDVKETR